MSIRLKIANWLAPELEDNARMWEDANDAQIQWRHRVQREREVYRLALRNIQALRTPSCAHIGKKMADIAESALHHTDTNTGAKG